MSAREPTIPQDRGRTPRSVGRVRLFWGYVLAVFGTLALAVGLRLTRDLHELSTQSLLMLAMVVVTALVGGLLPAVLAAVVSSLALNYLLVAPTGTLSIADPENLVAIVVLLLTGIAVATVVDRAARTTTQAVRARAEANALAELSRGLLRSGDSPARLLEQACEVLALSGAAVLRADRGSGAVVVEATYGDPPRSLADADGSAAVTPEVTLVVRGRPLSAADGRLLTAYAGHLKVLRERAVGLEAAQRAAELAEGNRTRTALLAAVSHDLRSPLSAIKAAVSSLRNTEITWSAEDEAELLAAIEGSADRLDNLIGNLLDMSRLQMGTINPLTTSLSLRNAVEWALDPIDGSGRVDVALGADVPMAEVDPGLLDRVIANVVENALRHTPMGTPVLIQSSRWTGGAGQRWVSLRVIDHGPGIAESARDALFAPFQRLGDIPNGDGLGLGLAVARGLTEAMGGTLSAEDTPGGGLTMVIDLPASDQDPELDSRPEVAA